MACKASSPSPAPGTVLLFYKYTELDDVDAVAEKLRLKCSKLGLVGRILLATEGINANLAGPRRCIDEFTATLATDDPRFSGIDFKLDETSESRPFPDLHIKVLEEIVSTANTMPFQLLQEGHGGTHLSPEEFHEELRKAYATTAGTEDSSDDAKSASGVGRSAKKQRVGDDGSAVAAGGETKDGCGAGGETTTAKRPKEKVVVLDVRNRKEYKLGHFEGAVDPDIKNQARWVPDFADRRVDQWAEDKTKVLMYCTGGIRCEKASAYLKSRGVGEVYQLSGGIHRYLETYGADGFFKGSNFVFDSRGQQRLPGAAVIATCAYCDNKDDTQSSDRVCAVCRDPVLVCTGCRVARRGVYLCSDHASTFEPAGPATAFEDVLYHPFLEPFTSDQLRKMREGLRALLTGALAGKRGRRRAVHKKIKGIDARLAELEAGTATPDAAAVIRCRSCSRPSSFQYGGGGGGGGQDAGACVAIPPAPAAGGDGLCTGQCWGFHRDPNDTHVSEYMPLDTSSKTTPATPQKVAAAAAAGGGGGAAAAASSTSE